MMRLFSSFLAGLRYLFVLAVLALAVLAAGSLVRGVVQLVNLAATGGFTMDPGGGAAVVPYFVRAAFLYFLAVALGSLFLGDVPAPQWMTVRNLFQFRTKVLTFISIILPLGFLGKMMEAQALTSGTLYAGGGVFLVLLGIFFLTRHGSPSGDETMARENNRVPEARGSGDPRKEDRGGDASTAGAARNRGRRSGKERRSSGAADQEEWLKKQKEDLKFQKETMEKAVEREVAGETGTRQNGNVTVRPGPKRPRGRRR